MVSSNYLNARKRWSRPQAMVFANNLAINQDGTFIIEGFEGEDFLILSDHNREQINFAADRIENRKRMINAHMRSYHIADKIKISTGWSDLPSRAFNKNPLFESNESLSSFGKPTALNTIEDPFFEYTADGGAGGADLLNWYENNVGSFYVLLSYDKDATISEGSYGIFDKYTESLEVYFSSFDYNVKKRGSSNHDLWDISLSLEEV